MRQKIVVLAAALCILLTACQGQPEGGKAPYSGEHVQTLLSSGIFSEPPEVLDSDIACTLFGVDSGHVSECQAYLPTSTNGEALALFVLDSADSAADTEAACRRWLDGQIESYQDYGPEHVPKLEDAVLSVRENTVLLVVGSDPAAAKTAVDGLD